MNKVILLFTTSCLLYGCVPHDSKSQMEMEAEFFASEILKRRIINGHYYTNNGTFSVLAPSQPSNTKFSERLMPSGYSIIFESLNIEPSIRYDIFPIKDSDMLIELGFNTSYQKAFLKAFFIDNFFSEFEKHLELKFISEDIIVEEEDIYYLSILNGPIGTLGALAAIKEENLIVISMGFLQEFPCLNNLGIAKQELSDILINYFRNFQKNTK